MKIAITSGKGGVGKTFVATCLASALAKTQPVTYIDCDVEAPNAHLFLKPTDPQAQIQTLPCIESVNPEKCTYCGQCAQACYFNALIVGKNNAMAFPELCRWCGACQVVCPHDALRVGQRTIGTTYQDTIDDIDLHWATLAAGAGGMTVPLIKKIQQKTDGNLTILDSPPGTSCAVVETVKAADRVILVGDPTRFGQHDLKLSVQMCHSMGIQPDIIINRTGIGDLEQLRQWCRRLNLPILAEIPDSRFIAELYSKGLLAIDYVKPLRNIFEQLALTIQESKPKQCQPNISIDDVKPTRDEVSEHQSSIVNRQSSIEIAVLSGKGGTGKTSLAACFAQLAQSTVADCDVDAADMHLLLEPQIIESQDFVGGRVMSIDPQACTHCGQCIDLCRWNAIERTDNTVTINADECEGCGTCVLACPVNAITTQPTTDGQWYFSATRHGHMSHAVLEPGMENSGKLVTLVRKNAASKNNTDKAVIVLDGSPGTGCPVIASVGGAAAAVIVTEPTVSGLHDLKRILELTAHFNVPAGVIINKADINPEAADQIRQATRDANAELLGELPYDRVFVDAQQNTQTVLEYQPDSEITQTIKNIYTAILKRIN